MPAQTVTVTLNDRLATLDRAVGVLRRRNLPVRSVVVTPAGEPGLATLTVVMHADQAAAEQLARQLRKIVGVHAAIVFVAVPDPSGESADLTPSPTDESDS